MPDRENEQYQKDYMAFHAAIGEGITVWSNIEYQLAIFFCISVNSLSGGAFEAFYAMQTFNSKLKATDAAAQASFWHPKLSEKLKTWKNLFNRLDRLSKTRNALAHHTLMFTHRDGVTTFSLGKPQVRIPTTHERWKMYASSETSFDDIKTYQEKCTKVLDELQDLNNSLKRYVTLMLSKQMPKRPSKPRA